MKQSCDDSVADLDSNAVPCTNAFDLKANYAKMFIGTFWGMPDRITTN